MTQIAFPRILPCIQYIAIPRVDTISAIEISFSKGRDCNAAWRLILNYKQQFSFGDIIWASEPALAFNTHTSCHVYE
jgi:hypothetical protein